jgi:hypothetical protein
MTDNMMIFQGECFSLGAPVVGNLVEVAVFVEFTALIELTTTVASEESIAAKSLAPPSAVAMFIVFAVKSALQV